MGLGCLNCYSHPNYIREVTMSKHTFMSKTSYPLFTKFWLLMYLAINVLLGITFFYSKSLSIPYIALALINLYAIVLLIKENRQGFYTLCSSELIFIGYTFLTQKPTAYRVISSFNLLCILITWICVRRIWNGKVRVS